MPKPLPPEGPAQQIWHKHLILLAIGTFALSLGLGLINGASTNFFVDTLGLSGTQVLWLAGIREIPGLMLMFIAALMMHLPLARRAALSLALMGLGYALYASVHSYAGVITTSLIASLGFHNWMPLQSSLGLGLTRKEHSGRVMGALSAVGALASILGMGLMTLLARTVPLRSFFAFGGLGIVLAALLVGRLPKNIGDTAKAKPRLLLKRRYWLYYVLTFFEGSRMQVFGTFGTLILVQHYGLQAQQIGLLLSISALVNFIAAPRLGYLLDSLGERVVLATSYVALALCFVGYATVHNAWFLAGMVIAINLLTTLSIGLSTYVNRIAPPEELTPTLSAGVSVNHITSVTMSLLAGTLLRVVGYENLCWGAATIILLSVPFALAIKTRPTPALRPQPAGGG
jgi:predicted MFS family arabinose efflux permease